MIQYIVDKLPFKVSIIPHQHAHPYTLRLTIFFYL